MIAQGFITLTNIDENAIAKLTNEIVGISCNSNGTPIENAFQNAYTFVEGYVGGDKISSANLIIGDLLPSAGITATKIDNKIIVTGLTEDTGYVEIPVSIRVANVIRNLGILRFNCVKLIAGRPGESLYTWVKYNSATFETLSGELISKDGTVDADTKNLKLKGRTLQNISHIRTYVCSDTPSSNRDSILIKPNTTYTLITRISDVKGNPTGALIRVYYKDGSFLSPPKESYIDGITKIVFTTENKDISHYYVGWIRNYNNTLGATMNDIMLLEGNWENKEISYFEGIKSVGEAEGIKIENNLFNLEESRSVSASTVKYGVNGTITFLQGSERFIATNKPINENVTISFVGVSGSCQIGIYFTDETNTTIGGLGVQRFESTKPIKEIKSKWLDGSESVIEDFKILKFVPSSKIIYKSTGKNLSSRTEVGGMYASNGSDLNHSAYIRTGYIDITGINKLSSLVVNKENSNIRFNIYYFYDANKTGISQSGNKISSVPNGAVYCRVEATADDRTDISSFLNSTNIMVTEGSEPQTEYLPYQESLKEIQLPLGHTFNGMTKVHDVLEESSSKIKYIQNVGKITLDGTENYTLYKQGANTAMFFIRLPDMKPYCEIISSIFSYSPTPIGEMDFEVCQTDADFNFRINKTRLREATVSGLKEYLKINPITVFYQLENPISSDISITSGLNIKACLDKTYITSLNAIKPIISADIPVFTMVDSPDEYTKYIGISENNISKTPSNNRRDYKWTAFKGEDGNPGEQGVSYTLEIVGGVRGIAYAADGSNPQPSAVTKPFEINLLRNGEKVSPSVINWVASGNIVGIGTSPTFSPSINKIYSDLANTFVSVSVREKPESAELIHTIPVICTKHADGLDWLADWNTNTTIIKDQKIATPRIFAGTNSGTSGEPMLTGVALGKDVLTGSSDILGLVGYKNNIPVFKLGTDGTFLVSTKGSASGVVDGTSEGISFDGETLNISARVRIKSGSIVGSKGETIDKVVENANKGAQVGVEVDSLKTYVDGAFKDGVIEDNEVLIIQEHLKNLEKDKVELLAQFNILYNNENLK